jgi:acetyl-CoA carboxylase biotin carboxyl carrier protein
MTAGHGRSRVPVEYGEVLLTVTFGGELGLGVELEEEHGGVRSALAFVAPMSGRFYGRPSPTDPPFVDLGDTVRQGQTVGLLEVMKTFNRLIYQGDDLPESARVEAIRPADGDDVVQGDVILALEPLDEG